MSIQADLLEELEQRWHAMFSALQCGEDLPPGQRLRAEGMMEALVVAGSSAAEVVAAMDTVYQQVFGCDLASQFGTDWAEFYPFPQIPAVGRRAPVYPSTPD